MGRLEKTLRRDEGTNFEAEYKEWQWIARNLLQQLRFSPEMLGLRHESTDDPDKPHNNKHSSTWDNYSSTWDNEMLEDFIGNFFHCRKKNILFWPLATPDEFTVLERQSLRNTMLRVAQKYLEPSLFDLQLEDTETPSMVCLREIKKHRDFDYLVHDTESEDRFFFEVFLHTKQLTDPISSVELEQFRPPAFEEIWTRHCDVFVHKITPTPNRFDSYSLEVKKFLANGDSGAQSSVSGWLRKSFKNYAINLNRKAKPHYTAFYSMFEGTIPKHGLIIGDEAFGRIESKDLMLAAIKRYDSYVESGLDADFLPPFETIDADDHRGPLGLPPKQKILRFLEDLKPFLNGLLQRKTIASFLYHQYPFRDGQRQSESWNRHNWTDVKASSRSIEYLKTLQCPSTDERTICEEALKFIVWYTPNDEIPANSPEWLKLFWAELNSFERHVVLTSDLSTADIFRDSPGWTESKELKSGQRRVRRTRKKIWEKLLGHFRSSGSESGNHR